MLHESNCNCTTKAGQGYVVDVDTKGLTTFVEGMKGAWWCSKAGPHPTNAECQEGFCTSESNIG